MSTRASEHTWRTQGVLVLVLLAEVCLWWSGHRTLEELETAAAAGPGI